MEWNDIDRLSRHGASVCAVRRWRSLLWVTAVCSESCPGRAAGEADTARLYAAGQALARRALALIADEIGSLNHVVQILQCTVHVASEGEYCDMPKAANGFSDVLTGMFGQRGKHARAAMGCERLEGDAGMTAELIVEVDVE